MDANGGRENKRMLSRMNSEMICNRLIRVTQPYFHAGIIFVCTFYFLKKSNFLFYGYFFFILYKPVVIAYELIVLGDRSASEQFNCATVVPMATDSLIDAP